MPKVNQLTVHCENRLGALAHIATVMGNAHVNILGFSLSTSKTRAYVKLVVDDVENAKEALEDANLFFTEQVVLHANLPNVPGALGRLAATLASKRINITSGYQTIEKNSKRSSVVLEVSNLDRALQVHKSTPSSRLYE